MKVTEEPSDLQLARLRKLDALREAGVEPFPTRYERTHLAGDVHRQFEQVEGQVVRVAGRLVGALRDMGNLAFVHLQDQSGRVQLMLRRNVLGEKRFGLVKLLDVADFVGVEGTVVRTRTGEVTVEARDLTFLSKAVLPLPEKWHGLSDVEKRHRQRYLDLIVNDEVRHVFEVRSRAISAIRRFLEDRGFVEVETPVLQEVAAGATARPFETHSNALDQPMYLRIALELHLKRCVIGGIERVFEIGRIFRNEGLSFKHNPEFTMLELYQAFADYRDIMELVEQLVSTVASEVAGSTIVRWKDQEIDLAPPWPRRTIRELLVEHTGVDFADYPDDASMRAAGARAGLKIEPQWNRAKVIDELMTEFVEPKLISPIFVINHPVETTPLAKRRMEDPREVERFESFVGGMELTNAFSELNDPVEQRARLQEQAAERAAGDEEAPPVDEDFLLAVEHGMPPTGGLGLGIDRLVMILTNRASIREVILFPQLRSLPSV